MYCNHIFFVYIPEGGRLGRAQVEHAVQTRHLPAAGSAAWTRPRQEGKSPIKAGNWLTAPIQIAIIYLAWSWQFYLSPRSLSFILYHSLIRLCIGLPEV